MEYTASWATLEMGKIQRSYEDSDGYAHYSKLQQRTHGHGLLRKKSLE